MHRWTLNMAKVYRAAKKIYKKVKNTTRGASSAYMQSKSFDYYLDSPKETNLGTNRINIEGWVLPKDSKKIAGAWAQIWQTVLGLAISAGSFVLAAIFGQLLFNDPYFLLRPTIPTP